MSAETSGDVTQIQDEESLRRMWQDTEDFGKKKEIRSHMYKLREERLKNFYSGTTESSSEIHRTQSTPGLHDKAIKEGSGPTHADSLADHSFLSLKSKEIRDSESPTRDMHLRITADKSRCADQGWQVVEKNETSSDGKTHTTSRIATTSGSDKIEGGVANYAAKSEQKASVYSDGDANNFTKSVAAASKNVIRQEAKGGDDNSNFQSFSTSTSSSSKLVTHHHSTSGDTNDTKALPSNENMDTSIVRRTYTTDVPQELKNSPNYIDGNTKVTTETRTLPDGTKVTTTRYETRGVTSVTSNKQFSSEQKSSNVQSASKKSEIHSSSRSIHDDTNRNKIEIVKQIPENFDNVEKTITTQTIKSGEDVNRNVSQNFNKTTSSTVNIKKSQKTTDSRNVETNIQSNRVLQERENPPDDVRIIRVIQEKEYIPREYENVPRNQQSSTTVKTVERVKANSTIDVCDSTQNLVKETERYPKQPANQQFPKESITTTTVRKEVITQDGAVKTQQVQDSTQENVHSTKIIQKDEINRPREERYLPIDRQPGDQTPTTSTPGDRTHTIQEIVQHLAPQSDRPRYYTPDDQQPRDTYTSKTTTTVTETDNRKIVTDNLVNGRHIPSKEVIPTKNDLSPTYEVPAQREPIRSVKPEVVDKKPTSEGHYQTTYNTDYVNRRISVEVSPTHDAFARSLRCISPDRDKKRGSTRSLKSSTSSLRSSTSPEKHVDRRQPGRVSPDRKSPVKRTTPDKFTSTETITKITSPTRRSPTKQTPHETINTDTITRRRKEDTTTITREIDSSTLTRRPKNRPRSRSTSPTSIASDIEYVKTNKTVTDLDEQTIQNVDQKIRKPNVNKVDVLESRPSSLNVINTTTTKKTTKRITERSPTSPFPDSPSKKSPLKDKTQEKPFKRRDTYEERCRQILGITETKTTKPSKTPTSEEPSKRPSKSPDKVRSPTKEVQEFPSQIKKSPEKQTLVQDSKKHKPIEESPKIQEFPSQIRRSPEKQPLEKLPEKSQPSKDKPSIQEFPSQVRKSPEKQPSCYVPEKQKPTKDAPKIQEFPSQIRRSPEKQPLEKPLAKYQPTKEKPSIQEFPSQIKKSPERQPLEKTVDKYTPLNEKPKPHKVDEPLFTERFISTLCREEEVERARNQLPQSVNIPFGTNTDQPHKTVKKDSPEKELAKHPERQPISKTLIDSERHDTDITITTSEKVSKYPSKPESASPKRVQYSPERTSPQRTSPDSKLRKETDTRTSVTNITERTDLDILSRDKVTDITSTEYTDEYITPSSPSSRLPKKSRPNEDKPNRKSPEKFTDTTEYTDKYTKTDRTQSTKRVLKTTTPTQPGEPEEDTSDSEIDDSACVRTDKETVTTVVDDGEIISIPIKSNVTEYPFQKSPDRNKYPVNKQVPEKQSMNKVFISSERHDTDITINKYEKPSKPDSTSPCRTSPDRSTPKHPIPDRRSPDRTSPQRQSPYSQIKKESFESDTTLTEYTDEYRTPINDKPVRKIPSQSPKKPQTDERIEVTQYTDKVYINKDKPGGQSKPRKESPDAITKPRSTIPKDYSPIKTPKQLTNGDVPNNKLASKPSKPGVTEYPSQKVPDYKKPTKKDFSEKQTVDKTFIDSERLDTDITITDYEQVSQYSSKDRSSPCRSSPDRSIPKRTPDRSSPSTTLPQYDKNTTVTTTTLSEYSHNHKPVEPDRSVKRPTTIEYDEIIDNTDQVCKYAPSNKDKSLKKSPEKFTDTTENTKTRLQTTKTTRPTAKPTTPKGPEYNTTEGVVCTTKKTTITVVKDDVPKKPSQINEYPSQRPKAEKPASSKITNKTTIVRKIRTDDIDEKIRTQKTDDSYTTKITKQLVNGDVPKHKIVFKPNKPQKVPAAEKPKKPLEPERKTTKRTEIIRIVSSPQGKSKSPDRYSPTRHTDDKETIQTAQTTTRKTVTKKMIDTSETKPKVKSPVKFIQKQPEKEQIPKRHVVTTMIQVTPKTKDVPKKPLQKTTVVGQTIIKTTRTTQPTRKVKPRKPLQNGNATTEEDSDIECELIEDYVNEDIKTSTRRTDSKVTRTTSDQIIKTPRRTPVRGQSKPELISSTRQNDKTTSRISDKKVITTKSIIINNDFDDKREVVVNLQRSKSSREPTPDAVYPRPASEDEDIGIPRYPDQISEPDEPYTRRKPTRLSDLPLTEDTSRFTRITEYDDKKTKVTRIVDNVEETDECLLTVNQKVNKFVDQAGKMTNKPQKAYSPTRKSPRPSIVVDETIETDKSYTSVDKSKTTTNNLNIRKQMPERPKSPKCKNYPDLEVDNDSEQFTSVSEKVSHFIETAEKVKSPQKPNLKDGPVPKVKRPDFEDVEESIRTDDCLLSVSDKVTKFTTTAQKLHSPDYKKPVSLAKMDITPKRESPVREYVKQDSPRRESPRREITTECVQIDSEEQTLRGRVSPDRYSPTRREGSPRLYEQTPTKQNILTRTDVRQSKSTHRDTSIIESNTTPKSSRTGDEPRSVLSPTGRLRSTDNIRKAKELFENIAKEQTVTKQRDILSRPSVFDSKKTRPTSDDKPSRLTTKKEEVKLMDIGVYNTDLRRYSENDNLEISTSTHKTCTKDDNLKSTRLIMERFNRPRSPEGDSDVPGYMKAVDRSPRPHSPYYDRSRSPRARSGSPSRERSPRPHDPSLDEIPHYMWPVGRIVVHDHSVERERSPSRSRGTTPDRHRGSTPDRNVPGYMRPLDRSPRPHSPYHDRSRSPKARSKSPSRDRSPRSHDPSLDEIPHYMWPVDRRVVHDHSMERERSPSRSRGTTPDRHRGSTPDRNIPGYMKPLDRQARYKSPSRRTGDEPQEIVYNKKHSIDDRDKTTKFGVTLKRTDSGRVITNNTTSKVTTTISGSQRRRFSQVEIERILTTDEMDEIYDLELLEVLLERATNYEQRRKIRAQIRIVKQLITENKLTTVINKKTSKTTSPMRTSFKPNEKSSDKSIIKPTETKNYQYTDSTVKKTEIDRKSEHHSRFSYSERRTSSETKSQIRTSSPETKIVREKNKETIPRKSITTEEKFIRRSPERNIEKTETRTAFKTELKRTTPVTKTVVEEKPLWVTQRSLKKVAEDSVSTKKVSSTTTTTKKQAITKISPSRERKPTDVITSSYGVGPTDENGSPLFGLKALRAQNKTDTTKVQGTVIRSHYYAENGQDPTGEISITKYSTDPKDLEGDVENVNDRDGLVSVTTTQKFGGKGTPSYRSITDKKRITDKTDHNYESTTTTTKVSRRGSVKEMSKKFIENAVETSKNERQSSYPKAGLILRTSSFKDTAKTETCSSSRESSPEKQKTASKTVTVRKTTTSSSSGGQVDTFLNSQTRVRGVQDVITRMKNADDEFQAEDTVEDREARSLLNKFIGSQVILSGMETRSSSSPSATTSVKRTTTTTTTTSKKGGKPTVITRTFTHPITKADLTTIYDEQTLKLLLERSTEYEERQLIRTRLREIMAEQEVCEDVVAKTKEESSGRVEGESLLLPLLQGLLDAPDNEQTADSGTESGEDLRSGLLVEVQNVLSKLANSLKSDSTEMPTEKRSSLLQLVTRLQTGLTATNLPNSGDRRGSGSGRFGRRRRQNRHTVGVSSEELEDARRLMQEFGLCDRLNSGASTPSQTQQPQLPLQKQNSEGSVLQKSSQLKSINATHKTPVKNAVAKPYGSSASTSQSQSGASSTVGTPTDASECIEFPPSRLEIKPPDMTIHHDVSQTPEKKPYYNTVVKPSEITSPNFEVQKLNQQKANQILSPTKREICESTQESETDEDTVKAKQTPTLTANHRYQDAQISTDNESSKDYNSRTNLILQNNPIYSKPKTPDFDDQKSNRFSSKKLKMKRANTIDIAKPLEFYETEDDYESDTSLVDKPNSRRNNYLALRGPIRVGRSSVTPTNMPVFEPKTDSDKKFMAFINKHNDNNNKGSLWAQSRTQSNDRTGTNWNNRFGNIKTAFEKASTSTPTTPNTNMSSARNFWKSADDAVSAGRQSYNGPKISKQGARNLQQMFEERDKQAQEKSPWDSTDDKNIVTGTLKVDTKGFDSKKNYRFVPQPLPVNKFSHAPTSAFAAIPKKNPPQVTVVTHPTIPSNTFTHTVQQSYIQSPPEISSKPYSANYMQQTSKIQNQTAPRSLHPSYTQPHHESLLQSNDIGDSIIKTDYAETDSNNSTPLYLYSPKPIDTSPQGLSTTTSPSSTPWASTMNEHRVQKLAASKFENISRTPTQSDPPLIKPRKMSKEKLFPNTQPHIQDNEKLAAPYLVKGVDRNSSVKKISDQFNNKSSTSPDSYSSYTTVKYGAKAPNVQNLSNYQPQNYTITYPYSKPQTYPSKQTEYESYQTFEQKREADRKYNSQSQPQKYSQNYAPTHQRTQNVQQPPQNYHQSVQTFSQPVQTYTQPIYSHNQSNQFQRPSSIKYSSQNYPTQNLQTIPKIYQETTKPQKPPEEYTSQQFIQFNQPKTVKDSTTKQSKPQQALSPFDYSSSDSSPTPQKPQYQRQSSQESVKEYEAAVAKVMKGPVSHQAVTVQQKSPKGRDEHDMEAAFSLKSVLQKFSQLEKNGESNNIKSNKKPTPRNNQNDIPTERKLSVDSAVLLQNKNAKATANLQRTQSFKKTQQNDSEITPSFLVNGKPLSMESTEINEDGESVITSKFHIPVTISTTKPETKLSSPTRQMLAKSDSWHQLMHEQHKVQQKPVQNSKPVTRSKSSHTLAVPTIQFQAGMTKDEVAHKKKTVEAYFSGRISPQSISKTPSDESLDKSDKVELKANKTTINRKKTSEKVSIHRHSGGVARSRTLPNIVCPNLLDESNVEASFEDLFKSNA